MAQVLEVSKLACGNFKIRLLVLIVLEGSLEVMGSRRGGTRGRELSGPIHL